MDAPDAVETRLGADAELGGDRQGPWLGARVHAARDLSEHLSVGVEAAWAPFASWSTTLMPDRHGAITAGRAKGRAMFGIALRTEPARAEAALSLAFGLAGEWRKAEYIGGERSWMSVVPSFAAASSVTGRVWVVSMVAIEADFGIIVTNEAHDPGDLSRRRAVVSPVGRAGIVVRF